MQGPKWSFLLIIIIYETLCGHGLCWDKCCTIGRAPHTREALPNFRELGRVIRYSRVFHRLTGSQRTLGIWGVTMGDFRPKMAKESPSIYIYIYIYIY